ncbi:MAG: SRPBCC domain-containing protein [Phycisphaerales bacterium]
MIQIRKQVKYKHPIGDVWAAITDKHAIAEWLMPNDFEPVKGHKFRFQTDPSWLCGDVLTRCEVLEIDPPRRMVWSWLDASPTRPASGPTRLEWSLEEIDGGTRLTLIHSGVEHMSFWKRSLMRLGWGGMLNDSLPKILRNIRGGVFTPGAIPLHKRYYKATTVPSELAF